MLEILSHPISAKHVGVTVLTRVLLQARMSSSASSGEESISLSPREESPASTNPVSNSENGSDYPDSGVVLSGNSHRGYPNPLLTSRTKTAANGGRIGANGAHPSPLTELRRPSIVEMMNTGGLVINQRGSCEINLDNVLAEDMEMLYALHSSGRRGSQEDGDIDSSWQQQSSEEGSSQQLSSESSKRFNGFSPVSGWWNPRFNSPILERHWRKKVIEFLRRRFRIAVTFIGLFSLLWIVFFSVHLPFDPPVREEEAEGRNNNLAAYSVRYSWWYVVGGAILFVFVGVFLMLTYSKYYEKIAFVLSMLLALLLMACSCSLALALNFDPTVQGFSTISFVAQFTITAVVILIIFALSRMPIWLSVILSVLYLIILEVLAGISTYGEHSDMYPKQLFIHSTIARVLFHVCLLLSGISTAYLSQVRLHATFWKIAQCVLSQKALDLERELEEKTVHSMMPKVFADELMDPQVQVAIMVKRTAGLEGNLNPALQFLPTPFAIYSMDRVTILFADIVDFTEFSASLSAAELVGILNEIFSIFDELVTKYKCEKISTLGDCYFCVSGCPEPMINHADNCVDMGLAIVEALDDFRKKTQLPIEMRIGIHTGSVFCGVMGTKRFKFDVWSRDVSIANRIESVGTAGRVLVSVTTKNFLSSAYVVEDANLHHRAPELVGIQLYYVVGRRNRAMSIGTSVMEWKRKIQNIDTICKPDDTPESPSSPDCSPYLCLPWKRKLVTAPAHRPIGEGHSSGSIVDIFSKQTQLQRCTSYADLTNPQINQQSIMDQKIVELMEEQKVDFDTYFDPQLKMISLQFHNPDWESAYHNYGRDLYDGSDGEMTETELGFRITKLSYMIDTLVLFFIYLLLMTGSAVCLSSDDTFSNNLWSSWVGIFIFGLIFDVVVVIHVAAVFLPWYFPARFAQHAQVVIKWWVRSLVALFLIYYPMTVVIVSIAQCQGSGIESIEGLAHVQMSFFVTIVVLISSINFMEVSHLVKLIGGALSATLAVVMVVAVHLDVCIRKIPNNSTSEPVVVDEDVPTYETESPKNYLTNYYTRHVAPEAIILLLLILLLLTVVNRMSEVSVRLSFIGRIEAAVRRRATRQHKTQVEWLLFNIIPPQVAYELRRTGKFSQNHECVGVIFATIVNFSDFYRHQSDGGEESLRILNRIVTEFDALLDKPRFANVEKVKTIGSTYMASSGLNLHSDQVHHLVELIDFAQRLIEVLEAINQKMLGFVFRMRIGFNYGPVTSGVVGSRKMLYDIWGDTVNVASRMDSTSQVCKIHMPEHCLRLLAPYVKHEFNKVVNVKGKGEMRTVFVTRDPSRTDAYPFV